MSSLADRRTPLARPRTRPGRPSRALALALACAALLLAPAARAQAQDDAIAKPRPRVYRWIDENGIAHYTTDPERIPSRLRDAVGLPPAGDPGAAPPPAPPAPGAAAASRDPLAVDRAAGGAPAAPSAMARDEFDEGPRGEPDRAASQAQQADLDARIAALEAEIAADEEAIQAMISAPEPGPGALAADDPAFREIASRLPKRLADLRALEEERARLREP
jgi:hypothetical protein